MGSHSCDFSTLRGMEGKGKGGEERGREGRGSKQLAYLNNVFLNPPIPLVWINRPLAVRQLGQLSLSSSLGL